MQFFALAACFGFETQAAGIRSQAQEAGVERQVSARGLRVASERGDQAGAFNDQVRLGERDLRGTAVGEKFEAANFVDDAFAGSGAKLVAKMTGDDQRAGGRVESGLGFEDAHATATARDGSGGVQARGRRTDYNYLAVFPAWPRIVFCICHRLDAPN